MTYNYYEVFKYLKWRGVNDIYIIIYKLTDIKRPDFKFIIDFN